MQQRYPRLADVIAAIEKTGRNKAEIGHMAGRNGSQATRWAQGNAMMKWPTAKTLADAIRPERPDLADELLATWHYYNDPAEPEPGSSISPALLASIRREVDPADQERVIEALERTLRGEPQSPSEPAEADESPARRAAS